MTTLIFDIETDGFLETLTKIHSLVLQDVETGKVYSCCDQEGDGYYSINFGLAQLRKAQRIVGHNIIKFDIPAIQKVYPEFTIDEDRVFDTLTASQLIWTNLADRDMNKIRSGKAPPGLVTKDAGMHRLDAWGKRLGEWKGDYSDMMAEKGLDPWASWNREMQDYCEQDVVVTRKLYDLIISKNYAAQALELEHRVAWIMSQVERNGYAFDVEAGQDLYRRLAGEREEQAESLRSIFKPWFVKDGPEKKPKVNNGPRGITKGCPYQKVKLNVFNPNSNDQIADRLISLYGWQPAEFTPKGKVKIDDEILGSLPYEEAKALAKYKALTKVIAMLAEGDNAWLKLEKNGRIHGRIITNGAVTGRATHSKPNVAQVPKVGTFMGEECRALFGRPWQLGCDVSGLELRMLAHFMRDDKYTREVLEGDIHTANQEAAGLQTRDQAKTFIYAFLYGAGNGKIGSIIGKTARAGGVIRKRFLQKTPSLKKLQTGVSNTVKSKGYLKGLDGRKLHIRSSHSALNTLLQSAGALVCKQWIVEFVKLLKEQDLYQTKVRIVAWVHDELQMEIDEDLVSEVSSGEYASVIGDLSIQAIENAGIALGIRVPLTGDYKVGKNWKDCH